MWSWVRCGSERIEGHPGAVRGPTLRPGSHHIVRALVSSVQAQPAGPGGDDVGARPVDRSHDHHALGPPLRAGVRETLATVCWRSRTVVARRRDIRQDPWRVVLSVSRRRPGGLDGRLQIERQTECRCCEGVLSESSQRPAARAGDNHIGRLRGISPGSARAESRRLAALGHEVTVVEVPEQPDRARPPRSEATDRSDVGFQGLSDTPSSRSQRAAGT